MTTADLVLKALETFGLKQERPNNYRCNSPLRVDSNSHCFTLILNGPEHGAFTDHVSGETGSLYALAKRLGIPTPDRIPINTTKRPYAGLADYSVAHGIPPQYLIDRFWREVSHQGRPALEFPTDTGPRYRFLDGDKKRPPYVNTNGYKRSLYGFTEDVMARLKVDKLLVICNGEISAIAGQFHGLAAVCITSGEKAEIPSALLDELKGKISGISGLRIIVAMDCDAVGNNAGIGLGQQLRNAGFDTIVVDLQLGDGGDLADFCMIHTSDSLTGLVGLPHLVAAQADENAYDWRFVSVAEVLAQPPMKWLIPRMLPASGVCTIYGPSGSLKTFVAIDLGLKIAQDDPVIYIAAEGEYGIKPRIQGWMQQHQQGYGKLIFVLGSVNLFQAAEFETFKQQAGVHKPALIIIDTFAMCMGEANENDAKDMMVLIRGAKKLAIGFNCAVLFVHHTNKEGVNERGSGRLRDSCDTMIRVSREDDDLIRISSEKTKDSAPFADYYLRPVTIDLGYTDSLGETVSTLVCLPAAMVAEQDDLTNQQRKVFEALALDPTASISEICEIVEIRHRGQVQKLIQSLQRKGYLKVQGRNRSFTEKGKNLLQIAGDASDSIVHEESATAGQPANSGNGVNGVSGVKESANAVYSLFQPPQKVNHQYSGGL